MSVWEDLLDELRKIQTNSSTSKTTKNKSLDPVSTVRTQQEKEADDFLNALGNYLVSTHKVPTAAETTVGTVGSALTKPKSTTSTVGGGGAVFGSTVGALSGANSIVTSGANKGATAAVSSLLPSTKKKTEEEKAWDDLTFWEKQKQNLYKDDEVFQNTFAPYLGRGEIDPETGDERKHSKAYMELVKGEDEKLLAHFDEQYSPKSAEANKKLAELNPDAYGKLDFLQVPKAFKDGYDLFDVSKTILGTTADAVVGVTKGAASLAEGVLDLGTHLVGYGADFVGADGLADRLHRNASVNSVQNAFAAPDAFLNGYSVFGKTTDSVMEGLGQVAATVATGGLGKAAGLTAKGVNALTYTTMGASSMGSGIGEAYTNGATDGEAFIYGLISGAADTATEMMFGGLGKASNALGFGKGLYSADDILAKKVSNLFSSTWARNLASGAIKAGAEGLEEVLAGHLSALGKKLTYMSERDYADILADENLLEQFIVGAATSGLMQSGYIPGTKSGSLKEANATGRDFITGLTKTEASVIDSIVDERVKAAKENGEKVNKNDVYNDVVKQLEKGYIPTSKIEEILGGDAYKEYQAAITEENKTLQELAELYEGEELVEQVKGITEHSNVPEFRQRLNSYMSNIVKDSKLSESYKEVVRRTQMLEADVDSVDEKYRATYQRAIDSKVMNNTNRSHEFVQTIARFEADTGIEFDFANNKKLKELGYNVENRIVNGVITDKGIILNMDSSKAWQTTVGHEISHALEDTKLGGKLAEIAFEYAKGRKATDSKFENEYKERLYNARQTYKDIKGYEGVEGFKKIKKEVVADLVGEYLFTDENFVNNLSTKHRNVFVKVYNGIKHLLKLVTAGSKEARDLERVKNVFDKAYRSGLTLPGEAKHSISEIVGENNKSYGIGVHLDSTLLDKLTPTERLGMVKEYVKELGGESFTAYDSNGNAVDVTIAKSNKKFKNHKGKRTLVNKDLTTKHIGNEVKQEAIALIDELIVTSEFDGSKAPQYPHGWLDNNGQNDWEYWTTYIQDKNNAIWEATLNIANTADGAKILYDISPIKKVGRSVKSDTIPTDTNVAQETQNVKGNFSLSDSNGRQLSMEQQEYFKDSVVRDENGNLKVMYHGTSKGGHTVFDTYGSNYGLFGTGSYFTDSKTIAESYTKKGKGTNPQVYESYLNIKNPLDMDAQANAAEWTKAFPDVDFPESGTNENFYRAVEEFYTDQYMPKWEVAEIIQESVEYGMGYDGITHIGGGRVNPNGERHRVYIAFQPEQIKNTDNAKPTTDPDIRYSLTEYTDAEKKAHNEAVINHFGKTYKWSETGYLLLDGTKLDLSGKHEGAPGGYRTVDHRDISDALGDDYGGDGYSDSLVQFMSEGNIRIIPEISGINLSVQPTAAQEKALADYISRYRGEVILDIDDNSGRTVVSVEYPKGTHSAKVLRDIREWFTNGTEPQVSDASRFRYSLSDSDGNKLSGEQAEYFKDSKMRDANGNLKVMYHGSQNGGFHVFDPSYSDDDISLFFVDRNDVAMSYSGTSETYAARTFRTADDFNNFFAEIGTPEYEVREVNGKFHLYDDGDLAAINSKADAIYEEFRDLSGLGYGDVNYKVYLDLKNPLVVDAKDREWNNLSGWSKAGYLKPDNVDLRLTGDSFVLFDKDTNKEIPNTSIAVNQYTKNMDRDVLLGIMINKANNALAINTEHLRTTRDVAKWAKNNGYDGVIFNNIRDNGGFSNGSEGSSNVAITFDSNQVKSVANTNPTADTDIRNSLSMNGETYQYGSFATPANALSYHGLAPIGENVSKTETVAENATTVTGKAIAPIGKTDSAPSYDGTGAILPMEIDTLYGDLDALRNELQETEARLYEMTELEQFGEDFNELSRKWEEIRNKIAEKTNKIDSIINKIAPDDDTSERIGSLTDADIPPERELYPAEPSEPSKIPGPFAYRDIQEVGNRKVKAFMHENPDVRPYFVEAAYGMLDDLHSGTRGEKWFNEDLHYESGGEKGWGGTKRQTTPDIAELLDTWGYTYDQIDKALNAIIEGNGAENNAASKRIEFMLDYRLRNGYTGVYGEPFPANQDYINLLKEKQIMADTDEARQSFFAVADKYAPLPEEIPTVPAPATETVETDDKAGVVSGQQRLQDMNDIAPLPETVTQKHVEPNKASDVEVLTEDVKPPKKTSGIWGKAVTNLVSKGASVEKLALKTGNRELQAKYNFMHYSEGRGQNFIGKGDKANGVKALADVAKTVKKSGKEEAFYRYLLNLHNVDRMTLANRYPGMTNKAVFGDHVTADMSRTEAAQLEKNNPEFKQWAQDVYTINNYLKNLLVSGGVISQETAKLWDGMYPHYVPISRADKVDEIVNVSADNNKIGVNAPKRAVGGDGPIRPLFTVMAERAEQTYKDVAKTRFGVELMRTLNNTEVASERVSVDEIIEGIGKHEEMLKPGSIGMNPTFTVFDNGKRVEFEITEELYDALKPTSNAMAYRNKVLSGASNLHKKVLTEYNPGFLLTNAIKDAQDIIINSQHPARTYAMLPYALEQMLVRGKYFKEYMANGGDQNSYFDEGEFGKTNIAKQILSYTIGLPLKGISVANNFVERLPRLAEYIASRQQGKSIEVAMLDSARVTTNFADGGDFTKFLNGNGATFLNASVQGAAQQVRNIREAKAKGLKGWLGLATRYALAGLPAVLLNTALWGDDDEYEQLPDYVKDGYYIVGKTDDGQFIRIPKGRTVAVLQNAFEQMKNLVTGDDEVDIGRFLSLAFDNLAPNNPIDNNIIAPIVQVANNESWFGGEIVPQNLQNHPAEEQYDESTDSLSRWLGDMTGFSPMKINYLLNQYGGIVGDMFLPMMTPEAERGDDSFIGNLIAPIREKFTTDLVFNNRVTGDFYDTKNELQVNANASNATDEDILMSKYLNSASADLADLYEFKREIQNSTMPDGEKFEMIREVQEQINEQMKQRLGEYGNVTIDGEYATVGGKVFKRDEYGTWSKLSNSEMKKYQITNGKSGYATDGTTHYRQYNKNGELVWEKLSDKEVERQTEVTNGLSISAKDYWNNKEEYDYAYDNPERYAIAQSVGGYEAYKGFNADLNDIKADKNEWGESINGSRKPKVLDYINSLDIDYGMKIILYKDQYNADDTYNYEIIDYLNGRDDISAEQMTAILRKIGFRVDDDGNIYW